MFQLKPKYVTVTHREDILTGRRSFCTINFRYFPPRLKAPDASVSTFHSKLLFMWATAHLCWARRVCRRRTGSNLMDLVTEWMKLSVRTHRAEQDSTCPRWGLCLERKTGSEITFNSILFSRSLNQNPLTKHLYMTTGEMTGSVSCTKTLDYGYK